MLQLNEVEKTGNYYSRMLIALSIFIYIIFYANTVFADFVVDNGDAATVSTGKWKQSGSQDSYDKKSLWSRDGDTYTWNFGSQPSGTYEVLIWWTQLPSRSTAIPVDITHAEGTTRVIVNQQEQGGQWNSLGTFTFTSGAGQKVMITSQPSPSSTCADAVWFKTAATQQPIIIDNTDTATSKTGIWEVSSSSGYYKNDCLWSRNGSTFTWLFNPPASGNYKLSMWWTQSSSRSTSIPVTINCSDSVETVTINQQENGDKWNLLGTYPFIAGTIYEITMTADADPTSTCADAVKFDLVPADPPKATIETISPNPVSEGQSVLFKGSGQNSDKSIKSYSWESSIDGALSNSASFDKSNLSPGDHIISLTVTDDSNTVSSPVTESLMVSAAAATSDLIIDNSDYTNTSRTGTWEVSGAPGYYNTGSVWSRDGATFTYHVKVTTSGTYDISLWWTEWSSRSTSVPVDIKYSGGTKRVTINQQTNGGQWNSLGKYSFNANTDYDIIITAQPGPSSTCADALKCSMGSTSSVTAAFTANKTTGVKPLAVQFTDQSSGSISQWLWTFGDGTTGTSQNPSHTYSNAGTYTVSLKVTGSSGTNTATKQGYITVSSSSTNTEKIYMIDGVSGSNNFYLGTVDMLKRIGATQVSNYVWQYVRAGKTYRMEFIENADNAKTALREQGSHIIIAGHANFGFGGFVTPTKIYYDEQIKDVYYVNDRRFVNYCTDMVSTKPDGMKYSQAYPNWQPKYSNGTSALAPYTFSQGTPPYNYYLTYKIPGDSTNYRIEKADGSYLQRFSDSGVPAWYSSTGSKPDPVKNSEYFIVNNDTNFSKCSFTGAWAIKKITNGGYQGESGYKGYNYQTHGKGSGGNKAVWTLNVRTAGSYNVYASWYPDAANASNAPYKINYAGSSKTIYANQRSTNRSNQLNFLGEYAFNKGTYTVELSDNANGQVVADCVMLNSIDNPAKVLQAEFNASVRSGSAPLTVKFGDWSYLYHFTSTKTKITNWYWDFGDGTTSTLQNPTHTYTKWGTFTVSLKVSDSTGSTNTETKNRLIAVQTTAPLQAEFTATSRFGFDKTVISFRDQSSGDITSRKWDFGDGSTSSEQSPVHTYTKIGSFDVTLTVYSSSGSNTVTETTYVRNLISNPYCDNVDTVKPHYYAVKGSMIFGKIICDMSDTVMSESDFGYTRICHGSCNSFPYFTGKMHRGIMFANIADVESELFTETTYLEYYLKGYSDTDILNAMNRIEKIHEIYNFNLKPPSMR